MGTLNWSTNGEFVFKLEDVRDMINKAPIGDELVFISVCYANVKSESGANCLTEIQACTGNEGIKGQVMALGCPDPPGCPK